MSAKDHDSLAGDWQGLDSAAQLPRYRAVARLVRANSIVLDVGCGTGVLAGFLPTSNYLGIEPSIIAAERAQRGGLVVHHGFAEAFNPWSLYDYIIFNESIYYSADPVGLLAKYAACLGAGGTVIVSIWQRPERRSWKDAVWAALGRKRAPSNVAVTRMVVDAAAKWGWRIASDELIPRPGSNTHWRVMALQPFAPNSL